MKKFLKIILINIILVVVCSICGSTHAVEDNDRLVDIPVPPASSGRAGITSEEANEIEKKYEEKNKNDENNSETLGQDYILHKENNIQKIENNKTEEKAVEKQKDKTNENENSINNNAQNSTNMNNDIENLVNTDDEKNDNKQIIIFSIVIVFVIIIILMISKTRKNNKRRK